MSHPDLQEVEVIPFRLDDDAVLPLGLAREWLSGDERVRADRFRFEIHQHRFTRGRAMLRRLLSERLGTSPGDLSFELGERGEQGEHESVGGEGEGGDRRGEGNHLGNLGLAYSDLGEPRKAIEFLKQSLSIGKAIEDPRIISICEKKLKELDGTDDNEN